MKCTECKKEYTTYERNKTSLCGNCYVLWIIKDASKAT